MSILWPISLVFLLVAAGLMLYGALKDSHPRYAPRYHLVPTVTRILSRYRDKASKVVARHNFVTT